jgi:excisionase family DNA binding protein
VTAEKQTHARASRARPTDEDTAEQAKDKRAEDKRAEDKRAEDKRADYLTARQLAEVLQVSESTVHRLRRAGRIPAVMLTDRLIRFNLRDVQKALRPTTTARAQAEGGEADQDSSPSPQLSFEDLYSDFVQ